MVSMIKRSPHKLLFAIVLISFIATNVAQSRGKVKFQQSIASDLPNYDDDLNLYADGPQRNNKIRAASYESVPSQSMIQRGTNRYRSRDNKPVPDSNKKLNPIRSRTERSTTEHTTRKNNVPSRNVSRSRQRIISSTNTPLVQEIKTSRRQDIVVESPHRSRHRVTSSSTTIPPPTQEIQASRRQDISSEIIMKSHENAVPTNYIVEDDKLLLKQDATVDNLGRSRERTQILKNNIVDEDKTLRRQDIASQIIAKAREKASVSTNNLQGDDNVPEKLDIVSEIVSKSKDQIVNIDQDVEKISRKQNIPSETVGRSRERVIISVSSTIEEGKTSRKQETMSHTGHRSRSRGNSSISSTLSPILQEQASQKQSVVSNVLPRTRQRITSSTPLTTSVKDDQPTKIQIPTKIERNIPRRGSRPDSRKSIEIKEVEVSTEGKRGRGRALSRPSTKKIEEKPTEPMKIAAVATTAKINWRDAGKLRGPGKAKPMEKFDDLLLEDIEDENYPEHFKLLLKAKQEKRSEPSTSPKSNEVIEVVKQSKTLFKPRRAEPYRPKPTKNEKTSTTTSKPKDQDKVEKTKYKPRINPKLQFPTLKTRVTTSSTESFEEATLENVIQEESPIPENQMKYSSRITTETPNYPKLPNFKARIPNNTNKSIRREPRKQIEPTKTRSLVTSSIQKFSSRYRGDGLHGSSKKEKIHPVYTPTIPPVTTETAFGWEWSINHPPLMFGSYYPDERMLLQHQLLEQHIQQLQKQKLQQQHQQQQHQQQQQQQHRVQRNQRQRQLKSKKNFITEKEDEQGSNLIPSLPLNSNNKRSHPTSYASHKLFMSSNINENNHSGNSNIKKRISNAELPKDLDDLWSLLLVQPNWTFNRLSRSHHSKSIFKSF